MSEHLREQSHEHLSEDQIDDVLMGSLGENASGHLAACSACQRHVAAARLPIDSFKTLSLAWSERRSATMPVGLLAGAARRRRVAWGATASALLAVMIVLPVGLRHSRRATTGDDMARSSATAVSEGQAGASTDEQIARDNQMLNEIEREVNSSGVNPDTLGLGGVSVRTGTLRQSGTMQD